MNRETMPTENYASRIGGDANETPYDTIARWTTIIGAQAQAHRRLAKAQESLAAAALELASAGNSAMESGNDNATMHLSELARIVMGIADSLDIIW